MQLKLKNPVVFLDVETTGIDIATDRIIEIALIKILPDGTEETKERRLNPQIPIPAEATAIHGISDDDVRDCPTFRQIANSLAQFLEGADIAGYNSNRFDVPILAEEFLRAGISINLRRHNFIDVQTIFHKMEQRTLAAAYKFYCQKELENAHSAKVDVRATYEVLQAQLDRYPTLENNVPALSKFSAHTHNVDFAGRMVYDDKGREIINFGKYKGRPVTDVLREDPSYYSWIIDGNFPLDTKQALTEIKLRAFTGK
ncbi:MAG: 3'-5' exonuclease [Tannerellaceae bacterium]|jgi:DNA polymerase-3 subunit epsilon|nr:3'-5' exonuclease [Tannerellaceae bacterium]